MAPDPDEPELEDPEIRRARTVLLLLAVGVLGTLTLVLVLVFRPRDQVRITRHENGYPRTRTHYVLDDGGRPLEHGAHRAWHPDGTLAEEGRYERGQRSGPWRFFDAQGRLDPARSGLYEAGRRSADLEGRAAPPGAGDGRP